LQLLFHLNCYTMSLLISLPPLPPFHGNFQEFEMGGVWTNVRGGGGVCVNMREAQIYIKNIKTETIKNSQGQCVASGGGKGEAWAPVRSWGP